MAKKESIFSYTKNNYHGDMIDSYLSHPYSNFICTLTKNGLPGAILKKLYLSISSLTISI